MARRKNIPTKMPPGLSKQQQEVFYLARKGFNNRQIAEQLQTSLGNVKYQVNQIRKKAQEDSKNVTLRNKCVQDTDIVNTYNTQQERAWQLARQGNSTYRIASLLGINENSVRVYKHRQSQAVGESSPVQIRSIADLTEAERQKVKSIQAPPLMSSEASFLYNTLASSGDTLLNNEQKVALAHAGFLNADVRQALFRQRAMAIKAMATANRQTVYKIKDPIKTLMRDILQEQFTNPDEDRFVPRNEQALKTFKAELKYRLKIILCVENPDQGRVFVLRRKLRYQIPACLCLVSLFDEHFQPSCTFRTFKKEYAVPSVRVEEVTCAGITVGDYHFKPEVIFIPFGKNVFYCQQHTMLHPGDMVKCKGERVLIDNWCTEDELGLQKAQVLMFLMQEIEEYDRQD